MLCQLSYRGSRPQTLATRRVLAKSSTGRPAAHRSAGSPTSACACARARSATAATSGSAGSRPASYACIQAIGSADRAAARDHREAELAAHGHPSLEDDAGGHPLADELQQEGRVLHLEGVRRPRLAVLPDLGDPEPESSCSQAASSTGLPRDLDGARRRRVAPDHHEPQPGAEQPGPVVRDGVGEDLLAARQVGAREHLGGDAPASVEEPHWLSSARSRRLRRCCSRATSSPNIRLYSVACSTGLVRCSRDFRSAMRRIAVSSRSRWTCWPT